MKLATPRSSSRVGFTLIELLVVIVILAVLIGLLLAAVFRGLVTGKITGNRSDISQLEVAMEAFKTKFGVYPPSKIMLCENFANYNNIAADRLQSDSVSLLQKMFPRIDTAVWAAQGIDWNGNGAIDPAVVLEGDQCLVFFLGGIPGNSSPPSVLGFSSNARNPAITTGDRIGPFFEFKSNRLVRLRANAYYSYLDYYGSSDGNGTRTGGGVYAYFSSYKNRDGYNRYSWLYRQSSQSPPVSDCSGLGAVWPYAQEAGLVALDSTEPPPAKYLNPTSYQIISPGANGKYGMGSAGIRPPSNQNVWTLFPLWTPSLAGSVYPDGSDGRDDQANFSGSLLGIGADN